MYICEGFCRIFFFIETLAGKKAGCSITVKKAKQHSLVKGRPFLKKEDIEETVRTKVVDKKEVD